MISQYVAASNVIDTHNQIYQNLVGLEERWLTKKMLLQALDNISVHQCRKVAEAAWLAATVRMFVSNEKP